MSNQIQNDPCPCGSGKKYKKCCGMSNVITISPHLYNEELDHLHDDLLAYALGNYDELFIEQTKTHYQPFLNDQSIMTEDYLTGLTFWTILNVPLLNHKQTIFDMFYQQHKGKIKRTRTRNTFVEWGNTYPSVYEIIRTDANEGFATIVELSTNHPFQIPIVDEDDYWEGDLIIGCLVPFVGFHDFLFDVIELLGDNKREIISLMKDHSINRQQYATEFPNFLAAVLILDGDETYEQPLYRAVIDLFTLHMENKGFDEEVIHMGIDLWDTYTLIESPDFNNSRAYAAALEYFIHKTLNRHDAPTQKKIASEYNTNVSTVSTNYRKLESFITQAMTDVGEMVHSDHGGHMEREMHHIQKLLSGKEFSTIDEANDFLDQLLESEDVMERMKMTPRDQAQDLLFDARESSGQKRQALIKKALAIYPNSSDAYLLLAEDANNEEQYANLLRKAVQVGEKDLGKAFFLENKGNFWMMIETRPYMRAKAMYADFLYDSGLDEEAIHHYEEMLRLNPNDNQGIRYILLTLYIGSGKYGDAINIIHMFQDDGTADFLFSKVLLDYLMNGFTAQTKMFIKAANKQNLFVKDYLQGVKEIPFEYMHTVGFGDETEAIAYAQGNIHLWVECPELLDEL